MINRQSCHKYNPNCVIYGVVSLKKYSESVEQ
jgi:hypothetical protein